MARLLVREHRFIAEFLLDYDEGRAALAAGFAAAADGKKLMRKRAVAEAIREERARRDERLRVSGEKLIEEFAKVAFSNLKRIYPQKGEELDLHKLRDDDAAAIEQFQLDEWVDPDGTIHRYTKVQLHDKLKALNSLARISGLLREEPVMRIEVRYAAMSPEERMAELEELVASGAKYLANYKAAVANVEIVDESTEAPEATEKQR